MLLHLMSSLHPASPDDARFEWSANEDDFPTALTQAHPPVRMLFGRGSRALLEGIHARPGVAIVGSRQASAQGLADAGRFGRALSAQGMTVVSGLAQGIDAAAHQGALSEKGSTIAVLGHGADSVYPPQHRGLAATIVANGGALITEYPDGTPARQWHFPCRNRIIAALCRAVLVIEAAPRSGSLITARHALELGIDVFALPGSIHMPQSLGTNALIREGAQLIQSPDQLLEDLGLKTPQAPGSRCGARKTATDAIRQRATDHERQLMLEVGDPQSQRVLAELSFQPTEPQAISRTLGMPEGSVYGSLLILELAGLASRSPDGRWLKHSF